MIRLLATGLLLAACGPSGPSCTEVADRYAWLMTRGPEDPENAMAARLLHDVIFARCANDGWSAEMRTCAAEIRSYTALGEDCRGMLPPEQARAMAEETGTLSTLYAAKRQVAEMSAGTRLALPDSSATAIDPDAASLVLEVTADGKIFVGGQPKDEGALDSIFRVAYARDKRIQVVLEADRGVEHGVIVRIMDKAKAAGLTRLAIGTAGATP